jgi:uncharacterized phage-like protein YoqJ
MIITFAGHSTVFSCEQVKEAVKEQIKNNISSNEKTVFYLGGYGEFDSICACACSELKKEYSIEVVYVTPYINHSKIKEMQESGLYDTSIYPPLENVPPKFAILKRNEWMIENANLVIAYVKNNYGGAYKTLNTAKRKKKKIINICDLLNDK